MVQQITNLKGKPRQKFKVRIPNGGLAEFYFYFLPSQRGWFFDLTYGDFKVTGLRLVNSMNVLNAYFNILRFGLCCKVKDGSEPYFLNDFTSERVCLYILSDKEVSIVEGMIYA